MIGLNIPHSAASENAQELQQKKSSSWFNLRTIMPGLLIFMVAFSAKLTFAVLLPLDEFFPAHFPPGTDKMTRYDPIALSLLRGEGFTIAGDAKLALQAPPVYPLFLSAIYFLFGYSNVAVKVILSLLDAGHCLLIYVIAKRYFNGRVPILAGMALAFLPHSLYTIINMSSEPLFIFLQSLFLLYLTKALKKKLASDFLVSGAVLGMAILCRAVVLLLPFFMALVFFIWKRADLRSHIPAFLLGSLLIVVPWTARNYFVFHRFIPVQTLGGYSLYFATFDHSDQTDNKQRVTDSEELRHSGRSELERDRFFYQHAWSRIRENPAKFLKLTSQRLVSAWYATHTGKHSSVLKFAHGGLLTLAIIGIIMCRRKWQEVLPLLALVVYYIAVHAVVLAIARYFFPIIPILIIFAAIPLNAILHQAPIILRRR